MILWIIEFMDYVHHWQKLTMKLYCTSQTAYLLISVGGSNNKNILGCWFGSSKPAVPTAANLYRTKHKVCLATEAEEIIIVLKIVVLNQIKVEQWKLHRKCYVIHEQNVVSTCTICNGLDLAHSFARKKCCS